MKSKLLKGKDLQGQIIILRDPYFASKEKMLNDTEAMIGFFLEKSLKCRILTNTVVFKGLKVLEEDGKKKESQEANLF